MKKDKQIVRRRNIDKGEIDKETKKGPSICYECKKLDHFKLDCPLLKKISKKKKKALMATWSDNEDSSSGDDQNDEANLFLMAHKEEVDMGNGPCRARHSPGPPG